MSARYSLRAFHAFVLARFSILSLCALAACNATAPASTSAPRDVPPAWQARPSGGTQPINPGTTDPALLDAQACATCHAAIAAEWAISRHALAWTNGIFQREYTGRPLQWCVNCHAPLTTQQAGQFRDRGVDCATCHVRAGGLVAQRKRAGSPHATIAEPSFGSPAYCADCHQFTFPVLTPHGDVERMSRYPMQDTVASFLAGPYARELDGCMTCHGSRTNHAYLGGHDPAMLAAALELGWCRRDNAPAAEGGPAIELSLKNVAAGHTVPTGDIHRHMNLHLWRSSAPEAMFEAFYGRRFDPADDGGKVKTWDSTIAPNATRTHAVPLAQLGGDPDEPLNLELIYVFLLNEHPRGAPTEPFTTTIARRRALPSELPACAP